MEQGYQALFSHEIWQEGITCVKEKKVVRIKNNHSFIDADVNDKKEYHVHIVKQSRTMKCTCEYAQEGNHCRHMAAVCIAYEYLQRKKQKEKDSSKTYLDTSWYPYVKKALSSKGDLVNSQYLNAGFLRYIEQTQTTLHITTKEYFEDLILLILFIMNKIDLYKRIKMLKICIEKLYINRIAIDKKSKNTFDRMVYSLMKKVQNEQLDKTLLEHYFIEKEDYPTFIDYAKQAGVLTKYCSTLLNAMEQHGNDPADIERLCTECIVNKNARDWLISYYKETKQYEKGIQILEKYCYHQGNEAIVPEQLQLFVFYSHANRKVSRDELFQSLSNNRHIKKSDLFYSLKESMSEEDWKQDGKRVVSNWCKGKSKNTCYDIYRSVDAPDLMLKDLIETGWNQNALTVHRQFLCKQDAGLVYTMYYGILREMIRQKAFTEVDFDFLYYYPRSDESIYALKLMIVKLQEEFSQVPDIIKYLERMEEPLYE